jgi:hypothetical protein
MIVTVSPLPLAVLRINFDVGLLSILMMVPIFIMVYYALGIKWERSGFYGITSVVNRKLGLIQLGTWLVSYLLYVVYTCYFIAFYLLNLKFYSGLLVAFSIFLISSLIVFSGISWLFFIFSAAVQILFMLPFGWAFALSSSTSQAIFTNVLQSSLLTVCITLVPYWNGRSGDSKLLLIAFAVPALALIIGGAFIAPLYIIRLASIGYFSLIVAEYNAINGLARTLVPKMRVSIILFMAALALMVLGITNIWSFYFYTEGLSIVALYMSLFISFFAVWWLKRRPVPTAAFFIAGLILAYGEYATLSYYLAPVL